MKFVIAILYSAIFQVLYAGDVNPIAALPGTWRYSANPQLSDGHDRSVSRTVRFEDNGGVFRTIWLRDFAESQNGKKIGEMRFAGFSREEYRRLDNSSLELIWRDFYETLSSKTLNTLSAVETSELASKPLNDHVKGGKISEIMGEQSAYWEILVFLQKDVFLRIEKTENKTFVTRYERVGEQGAAATP